MQKLLIPLLIVIVLAAGIFFYLNPRYLNLQPKHTLPTYFTYNADDIKTLSSMSSDKVMKVSDISDLSRKMFNIATYTSTGGLIGKTSTTAMSPYIAVAERDTAYLSYNTHQKYEGSLGPVVLRVICMFEPDECKKISVDSDAYSEKLADVVFTKIQERYKQALSSAKDFKPQTGPQYWQGESKNKPYTGKKIVTKTWFSFNLAAGETLAPARPFEFGSAEELKTVQGIKDQMNITDEQKQIIKDIEEQRSNPGLFEMFPVEMSAEMIARGYDLGQFLMVNSFERMMESDLSLMVDTTKYTYLLKRPYQRLEDIDPKDPLLKTISRSSTPSYASITGDLAGANEVFLGYLFPEKNAQWQKLGHDLSYNDIWQGDHFTIDVELSNTQGKSIGQKVVEIFKQQGGLPAKTAGK